MEFFSAFTALQIFVFHCFTIPKIWDLIPNDDFSISAYGKINHAVIEKISPDFDMEMAS